MKRKRKAKLKVSAVAIARDVIAQVRSRRFKPERGVWVRSVNIRDAEPGTDLQTVLTKKRGVHCQGCALGACFVSYVRLYDGFVTKPNFSSFNRANIEPGFKTFEPLLKRVFGHANMKLIEIAYEQADGSFDAWEVPGGDDAVVFGGHFKNNSRRLVAIMQNIIKNKGQFVPPVVK